MTTVEEIERAVERLPPQELARFQQWYALFDAERFDSRIERDAAAGRLDTLAETALAEDRQGLTREP